MTLKGKGCSYTALEAEADLVRGLVVGAVRLAGNRGYVDIDRNLVSEIIQTEWAPEDHFLLGVGVDQPDRLALSDLL